MRFCCSVPQQPIQSHTNDQLQLLFSIALLTTGTALIYYVDGECIIGNKHHHHCLHLVWRHHVMPTWTHAPEAKVPWD